MGALVDEGVGIFLALIGVGIAALLFVVNSAAENAIWDSFGKALADMGQGGLSFGWELLGAVLGIIAVVAFAAWAVDEVRHSR